MAKVKKSEFVWLPVTPELQADIAALPADGSGRIEIHGDGEDTTLHVVPDGAQAQDASGGHNEAHICPPICP